MPPCPSNRSRQQGSPESCQTCLLLSMNRRGSWTSASGRHAQGCVQPCMIWSALQMSRTREWGDVARLLHEPWGTLLCCTIMRYVLIQSHDALLLLRTATSMSCGASHHPVQGTHCHKLRQGRLPGQACSCSPGRTGTQDACLESSGSSAQPLTCLLQSGPRAATPQGVHTSPCSGLNALLAYREVSTERLALDDKSPALVLD